MVRINQMRDFMVTRGTKSVFSNSNLRPRSDSRYRTLNKKFIFDGFNKDTQARISQLKTKNVFKPSLELALVNNDESVKNKIRETFYNSFEVDFKKSVLDIFTDAHVNPFSHQTGRSKIVLNGKSKHYSNLRQFDYKEM